MRRREARVLRSSGIWVKKKCQIRLVGKAYHVHRFTSKGRAAGVAGDQTRWGGVSSQASKCIPKSHGGPGSRIRKRTHPLHGGDNVTLRSNDNHALRPLNSAAFDGKAGEVVGSEKWNKTFKTCGIIGQLQRFLTGLLGKARER